MRGLPPHRAGEPSRRRSSTEIGANLDDFRGLIESAGYRPFEGKHRVFILDDADRLSTPVQNALLKTLEEPPPSSSFVLVTSRPDLLLPTVRSRCPMLRFGRLPAGDVARLLTGKHGIDAARAHEAALAGEGSVGRALIEASDEGADTRDLVEQALQVVQNARGPADKLRAAGMLLEPGETKSRPRGKGGRIVSKAAGERDLLGQRLAALNAALRDLAARGRRRQSEHALVGSLPRAADAGEGLRRAAAARGLRRGRPGPAGARSQRQPEDGCGLAGVSVVDCRSPKK